MKIAVAICLLSIVCTVIGEPVGKGQPDPDIPVFDAASCGIAIDEKHLTEAEKRLLRIKIPLVDFRQANIFDMLSFMDESIARFGKGPELRPDTRVRIVWDSTLERSTGPHNPRDMISPLPNEPYELYLPPPYRQIPILYLLKMIVEGSKVAYSVSHLDVTVEQKAETVANTSAEGRALAEQDGTEIVMKEQKIIEKMKSILFPEIDFHQADLGNVIDFLQRHSIEYDTISEPAHRGVSCVLNRGSPSATPVPSTADPSTADPFASALRSQTSQIPLITFYARQMSLRDAVNKVCRLSNCEWSIQGAVVTIEPKKESDKGQRPPGRDSERPEDAPSRTRQE